MHSTEHNARTHGFHKSDTETLEYMDGLAIIAEKEKFKAAAKALFKDLRNESFEQQDIINYLQELTGEAVNEVTDTEMPY